MTVAAGFPAIPIRRLQSQLRSLESVTTHLFHRMEVAAFESFYCGGPPIEVENVPLTTFSWLLAPSPPQCDR